MIMVSMVEWGNIVKKHAVFTVQELPCQPLESLFYSKEKCKMQVQEKLENSTTSVAGKLQLFGPLCVLTPLYRLAQAEN